MGYQMFIKQGDGKILSVIKEEELDETAKKAVKEKLAETNPVKNAKTPEKQ